MRFFEFKTINLSEPKPNPGVPILATPIAEPIKRELLQRNFVCQIVRAANVPVPTQRDVEIAIQDFEQQQKRANREFRMGQNETVRRQQRQKRRDAERVATRHDPS